MLADQQEENNINKIMAINCMICWARLPDKILTCPSSTCQNDGHQIDRNSFVTSGHEDMLFHQH